MTYRIGWLSPLTPTSGVGTFSNALVRNFPKSYLGETIDLTVFYVGHDRLYQNEHRSIRITDSEDFHEILTLFDVLIYNIGNNREHHEAIFALLRLHPGIIICHDYVYQHYLADRSLRSGGGFASFAAMLLKYGDGSATDYLRRSRITSRTGRIRYSPWDSEASVAQPMNDAVVALGSALVVHSAFMQRNVKTHFKGPILQLGMPYDQKANAPPTDIGHWQRIVATKSVFNLVSFGHIQPTKCIDRVLLAIAGSADLRRRIRYTIAGFIGDMGYFEHLKEIVLTQSLHKIVSFELDVSETRLSELVQHADIFSNLRRPNTEGSSVSLVEQLEAAKPVVVFDSGCYAEIPSHAAIKLAPEATSEDIRTALEAVLSKPEAMPAIGRAGRAYARSWSCVSYVDHLMQFVCEHRALLTNRAKVIAIRSRQTPIVGATDAWIRDLARSRASLIYLDHNILSVDPAIVLRKTTDELCIYTANVILGIFGNARLQSALSRFFGRLDKGAAYWACVKFALIVDAVFGNDERARERLADLDICYDPDFWSVIEAFPSYQHIATVTLVFCRRMPIAHELSEMGQDDLDGYPKRLRMAELLRSLKPAQGSRVEKLIEWLNDDCTPSFDRDLPQIDKNLDCTVGGRLFKETVELSGFYGMEADHAWSRGHQGFVGMRLSGSIAGIDVLIHHIDASLETPCEIRVGDGTMASSIEVTDCAPIWLSLDLPKRPMTATDVFWFKLSTDVVSSPPNSSDTRLLGLCFLKLRVRRSNALAAVAETLPAMVHRHDSGEPCPSDHGQAGLASRPAVATLAARRVTTGLRTSSDQAP